MRKIELNLSTSEDNNLVDLTVRQDDVDSQTIVAKIYENGKEKDLSGLKIYLNAQTDDDILARDLASIGAKKNEVVYTMKSAFLVPGKVPAYFSFEKDGVRESTANFSYNVEQSFTSCIRQGNYIYDLEQLYEVSGNIIQNGDFSVLLNRLDELEAENKSLKTLVESQNAEINKKIDSFLKLELRKTSSVSGIDIVELKENGAVKYPITHANAIKGRELLDAKYLFTGSATFNDTVNLTENTDNYRTLLVTFSFSGNRGTLIMGNETTSVSWSNTNLTNDSTSSWVGVGEIELTRISNQQFRVTFTKIVKDFKEVVANAATGKDISLISIVGIR